MIKKVTRVIVLVVFLTQIGYMAYRIPQVLLTEESFPDEIKLSAIVAGICLGLLYFLKDYTSPLE